MNKISVLKSQAKNLAQALTDMGTSVSHSQALELVSKQYGFANWDTLVGVLQNEAGAPAELLLQIPEQVKSAKGCELLLLTSHDGAFYDKYVIVPPNLDAAAIKEKIRIEILRLKAQDATNEENDQHDDQYDEYTDVTLAAFVSKLGCLWVSSPENVGENWD